MIGTLKVMTAGGLPQLDFTTYTSQLFWLAITFGLLYVLLARVFLPRLGAVLAERRNTVEGDLNAASALRGEAKDAGAALEAALADARARAHAIVAKEREAMTAEIDAEAQKAEAALEAKLAEADATIAGRRDAAMAKVADVAAEAAGAVVQKLTGAAPDQAALQRALAAASQSRA